MLPSGISCDSPGKHCDLEPGPCDEPSGSVVKVDHITDAAGPGGQRVMETDSDVFMGDAIVTNPNGLAQIRFVDNTRIVVGPNSRMIIDRFVFNPDNTASEVTVSAVRGVFRFFRETARTTPIPSTRRRCGSASVERCSTSMRVVPIPV